MEAGTEAEVGLDTDLVNTTALRLRGRKPDALGAAEKETVPAKPRLSHKTGKADSTISHLRWGAARLASRIKTLCHHSSATVTIDNPDRLARISSLASFPLALAGIPSPLGILLNLSNRLLPFLPPAFHSFYVTHLHPAFTCLTNNNNNITTTKPALSLSSPTPPPSRASRAPPPSSSKIDVMMVTITATTLAHLRRTFTPWLGQHTWHAHPLDDLRLAVSNPDCFVADMLSGMTVWWVVVGVLAGSGWKAGWDFVGGLLRTARERRLAGIIRLTVGEREGIEGGDGDGGKEGGVGEGGGREDGDRHRDEEDKRGLEGKRARTPVGAGRDGFDEMMRGMVRVGHLVWVLVAVEYVFARGMNTAAWLVACYKLLAGGEVGRVALLKALEGNWVKAAFVAWQLGWYLWEGVCPLMWRSLLCAVRGQPGLLLVVLGAVGGVMSLLKYRSTFFIALQISDMFIFFAFLLVGGVMLGRESLFDNLLGLNRSTTRAKGRVAWAYNRRVQGPGL